MIEGISKLLNSKLTSQTNLLIKDFHDSCLQHLVPNEQLIVQNLTDGQIWHQLNQHLEKSISKWNKYLNKIEPKLQQHIDEEVQDQEGMDEQLDQYDQDVENPIPEEEEEEDELEQQDDDQENQHSEESDEMLDMEEEDVGLYGQLLDDENQEKYSNQEDEQEDNDLKNIRNKLEKDNNQQEDEVQDENFEHFREIQVQNNEGAEQVPEQKDEIQQLQDRLLNRQDWRWQGEVSSKQRPLNSLVQNPLEFKRGLKFQQQGSPTENSALQNTIKRRIIDGMFDDRVRLEVMPGFREHFTSLPQVSVQKSKQSLGELYEMDFANSLGVKTNKQDKQKKEILALFKQLNYKLDRLSNFSFIPRPIIDSKITNEPYILREQNIPITAAQKQAASHGKININLKSSKEEGSTRLKTKRIQRQRRKQQESKRMKRMIEYGGMSKVEAEARKKILKNKKGQSTKYSQSGQFFKKFQENISSKDKSKANPNIGKLKI